MTEKKNCDCECHKNGCPSIVFEWDKYVPQPPMPAPYTPWIQPFAPPYVQSGWQCAFCKQLVMFGFAHTCNFQIGNNTTQTNTTQNNNTSWDRPS